MRRNDKQEPETTSERTRMTGREKLILVLVLGAQFMLAVDFSQRIA